MTSRRASVFVAAVGLVVAVLTGNPTLAASGGPPVDDISAIEDLLVVRSQAILQGDVGALSQTRASSAGDELGLTDSRTARASRLVGFDVYREELAKPVVDLSPPGIDGVVLAVRRTVRVAGIDETDHVGHLYLHFVDEDGWKVARDDPLAAIGVHGERDLWELADVDVERRDRIVVVGTVAGARLHQVADLLEQALARFDQMWDRPWSGRVVMLVPSDLSEVETLLRPTVDASKFVAFTTLDVDVAPASLVGLGQAEAWSIVAPRIVAQESNFGRRSPERQVDVLVHELAHVASIQSSGPMTPLWMHEGLADWVTGGKPISGDGADNVVFPDLHLFRTGSVSQIASVYRQATETMSQLAGAFGPDTPYLLFESVGSQRVVAGTSDRILADVVDDVLGVNISELAG